MKALTALLLTVAILGLLGCGGSEASVSPKSKVIAIYDNHGGLAYPGHRITLYSSGQYEAEGYTDVKEDRSIEVGTYKRTNSTCMLFIAPGQSDYHRDAPVVYHIVNVGDHEYLLDGRTYKQYGETKDPEKLQRSMRKAR